MDSQQGTTGGSPEPAGEVSPWALPDSVAGVPTPPAVPPPPPPPQPRAAPVAPVPVAPGYPPPAAGPAHAYRPPAYPAYPAVPQGPRGYRETRPLRLGAGMAGFCAGLLWFVLLAVASWSVTSYFVLTLAGLVTALGAVALLSWRGDRGVGAGLAALTGIMAAAVTLVAWYLG